MLFAAQTPPPRVLHERPRSRSRSPRGFRTPSCRVRSGRSPLSRPCVGAPLSGCAAPPVPGLRASDAGRQLAHARTPPPRQPPQLKQEVLALEARAAALARTQASPQRPVPLPTKAFIDAPRQPLPTTDLAYQPVARESLALCTTRMWPSSVALSRFSTGAAPEAEEPDIRAGWFKSPAEAVSMEQLSCAHDQGCFFVLRLDHTAAWTECCVDFCRGGFGRQAQVNILSRHAALGDKFQRPAGSVALYFPGFQPHAMKLLFRRPGTACCSMLGRSPRSSGLQYALVQPKPSALPIGFSVSLRPKSLQDLTPSERLARSYFENSVAPSLGAAHDSAAAGLEALLEGLAQGERRSAEGAAVPAIFDARPGSQVLSVRFRGVARSASAPSFAELWQAPPGQAVEVKQVLLKRGDNPHQDRFALAMARVFNHLWEREGVAVSVAGQGELVQNVLYGLLQSGVRSAVIEVVAGTSPVRSFHDRHSKAMLAMFGDRWWQGDLNDWVPSAALLASAAAAFTTAYVLGIGDRHQDNMLVTREGRLFNIDFGYLFGEQPRFVDAQPFAIPVAFRSALVQNGPLWGIFKAACVRAFAALAKHREFVVLQAISIARALGSHFLLTHALTFGHRLAKAGRRAEELGMEGSLDGYVAAVGCELSESIERGVYGHQAKDALHERRCAVM